MRPEAMIMSAIGGALAVYWVVRSFRRVPNRPDSWVSEISNEDVDAIETPIWVYCLKPVEDANRHYCPGGNVTEKFTRSIPFVNIRLNCSIFETL